MTKKDDKRDTLDVSIDITAVTTSVKNAIDEKYTNLKGIDAEFDSIFEVVGFSEDFRKDLFSMNKRTKEIPMIAILTQVKSQLKAKKGITETEREKLAKVQAEVKK